MLIDWITARVDLELLSAEDRCKLRNLGDRIQCVNPLTGEIKWESAKWDSIRSDSHNLSYRCTSDALMMKGSPARAMGDGDAVFGSGASAALDLPGCVRSMRDMLCRAVGVSLPEMPQAWKVSRIDVTANLDVGALPRVRDSLRTLRDVEGGRYRVSQKAGDTVNWSPKSRLRKGKAYAKGPHLAHLMKQKTYEGRKYTDEEMGFSERLLRLELTLGAQWLRERVEKPWYRITAGELEEQWRDYFGRMLGDIQANEMNIEERVNQVTQTQKQAKAALRLWGLIKGSGWEHARNLTNRTSWYRNLKILREAGLSDADFSAGKVVEFRRETIELKQVDSWEELRRLAA